MVRLNLKLEMKVGGEGNFAAQLASPLEGEGERMSSPRVGGLFALCHCEAPACRSSLGRVVW